MIAIKQLKEKQFTFFATKENERYEHFMKTVHPAHCELIGVEMKDFEEVNVEIINEIDLNADAHAYDGQLCGFYDFAKEDLSGSYIYNSFMQTQVCFPYAPESYHSKRGLFVLLNVTPTNNCMKQQ